MNDSVSQPNGVMAWFAHNSVAANLLLVVMTVGGLLAVSNMPTEVFPEITSQAVAVSVTYPDASAEEVESAINIRVEATIAGIAGVKRVSSTAEEGLATITAELTSFANPAEVASDVTEAVDAITSFPPEGADTPKVSYATGNPKLLTLALYGEVDEPALRSRAEQIRDGLLATSRLADVQLDGVRAYEFSIEVSAATLEQYDLTLADIAQKITATSLDLAGGNLKTADGEILLRTPDKRFSEAGFASIPIIVGNTGEVITLADIATISDGFADAELINNYNGQRAVFVSVYRASGQGVLSAEHVVEDYLDSTELPAGLTIEIRDNATDELRDRINLMLRNAVVGFGLVFLSLVLFLDLRLAFWTSLAIPVSFLGGLAIAGLMGASINMVSLFALIIVLGIVVDDAVVV
ncbi:MAG: efflux RND transporter permease subunit, partial [Pseudomonadota bacterium]